MCFKFFLFIFFSFSATEFNLGPHKSYKNHTTISLALEVLDENLE